MKALRNWVILFVVAALLGGVFSVVSETAAPGTAYAASAGDFNPGNLISDEKFFDGTVMSASAIQSFLNERVPRCDSGYTCLKDYRETTKTRPADANGRCAAYSGGTNETAATIIAKVGAACGINQQALLVLLEKEQSLVTDTWPGARQYRSATGYGCPDTAPCDAEFYGFYNQVYKAAWQFKVYQGNPTSFGHIAGRSNNVRFNPNAACGSSQVFIQNAATAGLYNYTPYQPNAAALNNLYGTGDGCSSYGNRNFWRIFTDWFGSPTGSSSLVRTASDATVYLVAGTLKYPISSLSVLEALAPLGQVAFVTDSYLSRFTTSHKATQVLRGPDGSIYFTGAGIKLPFTDCLTVAHYGGSCDPVGYVQLDAAQISKFHTGPLLSRLLGTKEGSRYYMENGQKREILDDQSQIEAGIVGSMNVLTESAIGALPVGAPVVRPSAVIGQFGSTSVGLLDQSMQLWSLKDSEAASWGLGTRTVGRLREASIARLPKSSQAFSGFLFDPSGATFGLSSATAKFKWVPPSGTTVQAPIVSNAFLDSYATAQELGPGSFVKAPSNGTIYLITDPLIRPIGSWETLVSMSELGNPRYFVVPQKLIDSYTSGPIALEAATMVRSTSDATVYIINGITNKIPISSFDPAVEAGLNRFSYTLQDRIDAYPMSQTVMEYGIICDGKKYLAAGGKLHEVPEQLEPHYPYSYMELDQYVCRLMKVGSPATQFIRTPDGSMYQVLDGTKRPISNYTRFAELDITQQGYMNVTTRFAVLIPTGPVA